ncbi:MAG: cupin domain-containing protein [Acetobacter papayae]|uniref:(R)-mandelonitrile lyase n=1 Tax=Acetobacter papayae TaxID=1076592 RepID=UPI0039E91FD3
MQIRRSGSSASVRGAEALFTGTVRIDAPFAGSGGLSAATVTFEPGARTAWHTHPLGQTLLVTAGLGMVQREGEEIQLIRPGDVVWIEPGEKHWHGASRECAMTHIAIAEMHEGSAVTWLEHVSDADYAQQVAP